MTTKRPRFALVLVARLRAHEEIDPAKVEELVDEFRRSGVFLDPIWVARGTDVILNGHHRVAAARRLGATRVPAWVVDYDDRDVSLDRWQPGPALSKQEVVARARQGKLFPPKTTRHRIALPTPPRPTPIARLLPRPRAQRRGSKPSRPRPRSRSRAGPASGSE